MSNINTAKTIYTKRLAWLAAILCIACCAMVPLLVLLGVAGAATLGIYLEYAAAGFFIASLIIFGYLLFKNKKQLCKIDCPCKDSST